MFARDCSASALVWVFVGEIGEEEAVKPKLTDKQAAILKFVRRTLKKRGFPPTRKEIADEFGFSSHNAAQQHLKLIELKGYIRLSESQAARGIKVL